MSCAAAVYAGSMAERDKEEEHKQRASLFQSIKLGLGGGKKEEEPRKAGSMISSPSSISYPFDVVHKRNVAPPGAPPDLYSNRPPPSPRASAAPASPSGGSAIVVSPRSRDTIQPAPSRPVSSFHGPNSARQSPPRAASPRRTSPPRSRAERAASPRRSSPTRAASPRRSSPSRASSPRRGGASPPRSSTRALSPRRRSPPRSRSPNRSPPRRRSPPRGRVSPSRVRSPRHPDDPAGSPTGIRKEKSSGERATSPRRGKSPVRTSSARATTAPTRTGPPYTRPPPSASAAAARENRQRTAAERRTDREREREVRERERDARDRRRPAPGSSRIHDLSLRRGDRREHVQRGERKAPREDARAVARHLNEKATTRTADVRKRAADTGDLPFFGVTRVRPVNTTRTAAKPRLMLKGDEETVRPARWTRSDGRAFNRSIAKFDAWVEERNLKPLLEARRAAGRAMTMMTGNEAPPAAAAEPAVLTKEELMTFNAAPQKKRVRLAVATYTRTHTPHTTPHHPPHTLSPHPHYTHTTPRVFHPLTVPATEWHAAPRQEEGVQDITRLLLDALRGPRHGLHWHAALRLAAVALALALEHEHRRHRCRCGSRRQAPPPSPG